MELRPRSALFPSQTTVGKLGAMERVTVEVQGEPRMQGCFVRLRVPGLSPLKSR